MIIEHPYMEGKTLHERQSQFYNGHRCPYCGEQSELIDSIKVYQESHGLIYYCEKDAAWVGVHKGGDQSLGTLAKKKLRQLRHEAHLHFDPLWLHKKKITGHSVRYVRGKAYNWVAKLLGVEREAAHIGFLNSVQCEILIAECKKFRLTPEQIEAKERAILNNINIVEFLAGELGYDFTRSDINGVIHISIEHPVTHGWYNYRPKEGIATIPGTNSKWKPVEDIEKFIYENFKTEPCQK